MSTSTIQIKRGTGSAVPSGLTDGELAINLDSGRLYYGSGSNSVDSYTFTHVTASGNISASGFGSFTGDIIAGGEISASGDLVGDKLNIGGIVGAVRTTDSDTGNLYTANGINTLNLGKLTHLTTTNIVGSLNMSESDAGHITASGNISASGNITATGNINATGNISSSGDVMADRYFLQGTRILSDSGGEIQINETTLPININGPSINLAAPVTASGNISASGDIINTGNVVVGGDLDVDGTANFDDVDVDGDITIADQKNIIAESRLVMRGPRLTLQVTGSSADAVNIASGSTVIAKFAGGADLVTGADHTRIVLGSADIVSQTSTVKVDGTLETTSHISASGDITASGGLTLGDGRVVGFSGNGRGTIGTNRLNLRGGETIPGNIQFLSGSTSIATMDCGLNGGQIGLGSVLIPSPVVTITGDLTTTSHITASGNISSSGTIITSILSGGATGDQSGSLHLSGSLTFRANEPEPAVSASTLFVKQKSTDNAPDTDLRFSNSGLTPAFAWVTLDDDATADSSEYGFGHDSAVTSNTHNMIVTHDSSGDGVKIFSQIDGTYKVTGNYVVINSSTSTDVVFDTNVDGSTVHTYPARVHSSVDPVERTQIYVGTVNSGSFIRTTVDGTSCILKAGSVLTVERLA